MSICKNCMWECKEDERKSCEYFTPYTLDYLETEEYEEDLRVRGEEASTTAIEQSEVQ